MSSPTITMKIDGVSVTCNASNAVFMKRVDYSLPDVFFQYFLIFPYKDGANNYLMDMRFYTQAMSVRNYIISNMAGMSDMEDIKDSNAMTARTYREYSRLYNSWSDFHVNVTSVASNLAAGTFEGKLNHFDNSSTIDPSTGLIALPGATQYITITEGAFSNIPIIT